MKGGVREFRHSHAWRALSGAVAGAVAFHLVLASGAAGQTGRMGPDHGAGTMELDRMIRTFVLADVLEYEPRRTHQSAHLEALGWIGDDYNRVWLRVLSEQPTHGQGGDYQGDALYGRLVSPFWNALIGGRVDTRQWAGRRATRGLFAVGLEGIPPYWIELEPTVYVSPSGDVSARVETATDVLFTQRLIVQPRVEINAAAQRVPDFGVGAGINDLNVGVRARYEFTRKFAPYVGLNWFRRTGETAALARRTGEFTSYATVVFGVRAWR